MVIFFFFMSFAEEQAVDLDVMQRLHKSVIVQAGHLGLLTFGRPRPSHTARTFHAGLRLTYPRRYHLETRFKMMVDMGSTEKREPIMNVFLEKEDDGFAIPSGGCKRCLLLLFSFIQTWISHWIIHLYEALSVCYIIVPSLLGT